MTSQSTSALESTTISLGSKAFAAAQALGKSHPQAPSACLIAQDALSGALLDRSLRWDAMNHRCAAQPA